MDPLPTSRAGLEADGVYPATLYAIDADGAARVAAGEQEARNAPEPDPAVLETQLWADGGSSWRN